MGNGIAHVFAQNGWPVTLIDTSPRCAREGRRRPSRRTSTARSRRERSRADEPAQSSAASRPARTLAAAAGASLVVEAASENPTVKFAIFEQLDRVAAPDAILATNTSSISITEIAARTKRPEHR